MIVVTKTLEAIAGSIFNFFKVTGTSIPKSPATIIFKTIDIAIMIDKLMKDSLMLVTALTPVIGYDNAAIIAKNAHKNGTSIKDEAINSGFIDEKTFEKCVQPKKMIGPG